VPVKKVSLEEIDPKSKSKCVCGSMIPGITKSPLQSNVSVASKRVGEIAAIFPSLM